MFKECPLPPGTVRIQRHLLPVRCFVDGILYKNSDHGWVEVPPIEMRHKRQEEVKIYKSPWNDGSNPDVCKRRTPKFSLPRQNYLIALLRRTIGVGRKREEERKRERSKKHK